jgi:hypothetical protein
MKVSVGKFLVRKIANKLSISHRAPVEYAIPVVRTWLRFPKLADEYERK